MPELWSIDDENADLGYRNLSAGVYAEEREMREAQMECGQVTCDLLCGTVIAFGVVRKFGNVHSDL